MAGLNIQHNYQETWNPMHSQTWPSFCVILTHTSYYTESQWFCFHRHKRSKPSTVKPIQIHSLSVWGFKVFFLEGSTIYVISCLHVYWWILGLLWIQIVRLQDIKANNDSFGFRERKRDQTINHIKLRTMARELNCKFKRSSTGFVSQTGFWRVS